MPFYEYKKNKVGSETIIPDFIETAFHFWDPDTKTDFGYTPVETKRDYYIPDTLKQVTMDDLVARGIDLKTRGLMFEGMTDEDLETWIRKKFQRYIDKDEE